MRRAKQAQDPATTLALLKLNSVIAPGSVNTQFGDGGTKDRSRMIQPADVAEVVAMLVTQASNSFVSEVLLRPTVKP